MKAERNRNHQTLLWLMLTAMMISLTLDALAQTRKETQRRARPQSQFNPQLAEQIISVAREEGLDPLLNLEVMRVESGFNRRALSLKMAVGLMQMIEDSALTKEPGNEGVSTRGNGGLAPDPPHTGVRIKRSQNGWGIARTPEQITYYQMHACLRGMFKRTDREKAEVIYSWTSPADIDVKVFTSVDARTGLSRPIGKDAIRVVVYDKRARRKINPWSVELKRTGNWNIRLQEKVGAAILHASYRPRCSVCRQETMIIYGRPESQFWGCLNYPECGGTLDINL